MSNRPISNYSNISFFQSVQMLTSWNTSNA